MLSSVISIKSLWHPWGSHNDATSCNTPRDGRYLNSSDSYTSSFQSPTDSPRIESQFVVSTNHRARWWVSIAFVGLSLFQYYRSKYRWSITFSGDRLHPFLVVWLRELFSRKVCGCWWFHIDGCCTHLHHEHVGLSYDIVWFLKLT